VLEPSPPSDDEPASAADAEEIGPGIPSRPFCERLGFEMSAAMPDAEDRFRIRSRLRKRV
jgi:hypothetical protein